MSDEIEQPVEKPEETPPQSGENKPKSAFRRKFFKAAKVTAGVVILAGVFRLFTNPMPQNIEPTTEFTQNLDPVKDADLLRSIEDLNVTLSILPESEMGGKNFKYDRRSDGGFDIMIKDHGNVEQIKSELETVIRFLEQSAPRVPDLSK
ncbi:MAG: hypothetical protein GC137_08795 [Alphaproteobacteria bacterium]|nr:hypothetical protein [Alphaproteobacteria bacterium]